MRALLDTHTFLWWITDDARLSSTARALIADRGNRLLLSSVVVWEIALKASLGKLPLPAPAEEFLPEQIALNALQALPVTHVHALRSYSLPWVADHRDPFDRMLACQALVENLPILTADPAFGYYAVQTIW